MFCLYLLRVECYKQCHWEGRRSHRTIDQGLRGSRLRCWCGYYRIHPDNILSGYDITPRSSEARTG